MSDTTTPNTPDVHDQGDFTSTNPRKQPDVHQEDRRESAYSTQPRGFPSGAGTVPPRPQVGQSNAGGTQQSSSAPSQYSAGATPPPPPPNDNDTLWEKIKNFFSKCFASLQALIESRLEQNRKDILDRLDGTDEAVGQTVKTVNDHTGTVVGDSVTTLKGHTDEAVKQTVKVVNDHTDTVVGGSVTALKGHIDWKAGELAKTQQELQKELLVLNGTFQSLENSIKDPETGITAQLVQKTKEQLSAIQSHFAEIQKQSAAIWGALPDLEGRLNTEAENRKQQLEQHISGVAGDQRDRLERHITGVADTRTQYLEANLNRAAAERVQKLQDEITRLIADSKELSAVIESKLAELTQQNADIPGMVINPLRAQIDAVTQLMNDLGKDLQTRYDRIVEEEQRIGSLIAGSKQELENKIDGAAAEETALIKEAISTIKTEIVKTGEAVYKGIIQTANKNQEQANQKLDAIRDILANQLEQSKAEVQRLERDKDGLIRDLDTARGRGEQLIAELNQKKDAFAALTLRCNTIENQYNEQKRITEPYASFITDYKHILALLLQCESLHDLSEGMSNPENTDDMLKFLLVFGSEQSFALKVYTAMREYKKLHKEALSDAERTLIAAINSFYRQNRQLEFDVFEIAEPVDGTIKFDKNKMQDMERPADTVMRGVEAVYVPTLRRDAAVIAFKAIVKGIK